MRFTLLDGSRSVAMDDLIRKYLQPRQPMLREVCETLIMQAWPEIAELHFVDFKSFGMGAGTDIEINDTQTVFTDKGHYQGEILMVAEIAGNMLEYTGLVRYYGRGPGRPAFKKADIAFLQEIPRWKVQLNLMLKSAFPHQGVQVMSIPRSPLGGPGNDFRFDSIQPLGMGTTASYWEIEGTNSQGFSTVMNVSATSKLHIPSMAYFPILGVIMPGQPNSQGFTMKPGHPLGSAVVPSVLGPYGNPGNQPSPSNIPNAIPPQFNVNPPIAVGGFLAPKGPPNGALQRINDDISADKVLTLLERELGVKTGMLGATNMMIYRISVPQGSDWREIVRGHLEPLKTLMGDKVGVLGDCKIIGLDEPPEMAGRLGCGTERQTGRFAVHLAYRSSYQHHKITILALVKAP